MNLGAVNENMIFGVLLVLLFFAWWKSSLRSAIVEGAWEGILEDYGNPGPALGVEGISPFLAGDTNNYHSYEHFIEDIKYSLHHGRYNQLAAKIQIFLTIEFSSLVLLFYIIALVTTFILAIIYK